MANFIQLSNWVTSFYKGDRLSSETQLQAAAYLNSELDISSELAVIRRSQGRDNSTSPLSSPHYASGSLTLVGSQSLYQQRGISKNSRYELVLQFPEIVDAILLYGLIDVLSYDTIWHDQKSSFYRLGELLDRQFNDRPDIVLQLVQNKNAFSILKTLPYQRIESSAYYRNTACSIYFLHSLWAKGCFELIVRNYASYAFNRRSFPKSDFMLRCFTNLGLDSRVSALFRDVYHRYHKELQLQSISNMLFVEHGMEKLDQHRISILVKDYHNLSRLEIADHADVDPPSKIQNANRMISIHEKKTIAVVSADLRNHPVGRFWLPIVSALYRDYNIVYVALNSDPNVVDQTRSRLKSLSTQWCDLYSGENPLPVLRSLAPDVLIDLGGHTADNQPGLLNFRIAPLQITYLGFYGPSYGNECDWWVLDREIASRVGSSYHGAESIWALPCPSLCFDPDVHGVPSPDKIYYTNSSSPVFGSFNHTRKLTQQCLSRFHSVLGEFPDSKLLFRAHSFFDPQIRRWFLSKLVQSGVAPYKLLAIPYAPTPFEGYCDYGRIHVHFDTFPVCGTTTTLDSLAMGIPVLTSPNHLYAGAISSAIIEHAGFTEWIAEHPDELPQKASELFERYRTADSRRALANHIRSSSLCDTLNTPRIFSEQLIEMMKCSNLRR
ncbi:hypothetical protein [Synechococcus sp. A15-24]|uniref:O-linked N-acetylglucosamine transferase family protein n=1 Tax=Synechococcus sp. A15-24 TaxID=1050635 RepID=UPI001646BEE3|nr:hypothetical protein [Synechococcus sp. A15-24]